METKPCEQCGTPIHRPAKYSKAQWAARRFCSLRCHGLFAPIVPMAPLPLAERFWALVDKRGPDECWPWKGGTRGGYGTFRVSSSKVESANRTALRLDGRLPDDKDALHSCDNPPCCNPAHLFPGTPLDNARDRDAKGRGVVPNRRKILALVL